MREPAIIEAPSVRGPRPTGVQDLPVALLGAGPATRNGAVRAHRIEAPPYDPERDSATGVLHPAAIAGYSARPADAVPSVPDASRFPVVLGGDCAILLGTRRPSVRTSPSSTPASTPTDSSRPGSPTASAGGSRRAGARAGAG
ncbi:hypothetical protein [Streptomyces sp. NPDC046887]|uniref:hypothetical protein n=1 Tax=Streptomyces sp. NPDC046887 TaxID=3155472 RepID=UPI0033D5428A